ncbi:MULTISPECIES: oligosaccharide flippase family protein [unclassified Curtobacterium]|uniref:oligosaccharide flippase family protein n=1 Tax=unclassified Curtobacterium TaxID=257496 RepID=UPI0008DD64E8|nr:MULTISPECIES: oligosaccharide flippase family protein [unclassified Curtobacterium]OIH93176.1 hypothetical protein BIU92_10075 [Curtobacterium sp. MCBA15_003]OII10586.1 hypothetical protein BIU97_10730 [Curtobacterium sp. MCBA15_009]OII30087.1 hypothetical protein BIU94_10810 [Curtobacterium sp. MMLR14_006]
MFFRSGLLSLGGTLIRSSVQILANVVVARILGPEHYGAAAVVLGLSIVLELVRSGGFAAVVLRSGAQPEAVLVALHRMSALLGLVLGVAVATAGALAAWLAPDAPYGVLLLAIAVAFPVSGAVAVPIATMARRAEMGRVVAVESAGAVLGASTAVLLALAGVGPIAVIAQVVVLWTVVGTGVAVLRRAPRGEAAPWPVVREMVGIARDVSIVQVVMLVFRTGDRVLVAALFGSAASGVYVQAVQLMTLPLEQIGAAVQRVALPALAEAGPTLLTERLRQFTAAVTLLAWPVLALLGVLAGPVVELLFGSAWSGSADLLPFLVVGGAARALGCVPEWWFVASGHVRRQIRWVLVSQPLTIAAFVAGSPWGVRGMVVAYAAACAALVLPSYVIALRGTGVRLRTVLGAALPAATVASAAAVSACIVRSALPEGAVTAVFVPAVCGVLVAVVTTTAFPATRAPVRAWFVARRATGSGPIV